VAAAAVAAGLVAGLAISPVASQAATQPAAAQAQHAANWKKGVGAWAFSGATQALNESGASWYYTWTVNPDGITPPPKAAFVPMIWGPTYVTPKYLAEVKTEGHVLLGFNEPDLSKEANMTVSQALQLWPQLMSTGMRLGSPAVAANAATPGSWLDQFMTGAAARHYRVNFIQLHWYGGNFDVSQAVSELQSYIESVWNMYHKPIWLTEFALWRFNPSVLPSSQVQAAFLTAATSMLEKLPYVWRYAWYGLGANSDDGSTGLFNPGPTTTVTGTAFEKVDSGGGTSPTPTTSASATPTTSASPSPTTSASPSPTTSASASPTTSATPTPTTSASSTPTTSASPSPTTSASQSPTTSASATPTVSASPSPSPRPTTCATASPTTSASVSPTTSASPTPTSSATTAPAASGIPVTVWVPYSGILYRGAWYPAVPYNWSPPTPYGGPPGDPSSWFPVMSSSWFSAMRHRGSWSCASPHGGQ
jgi:Glycosyl hydrolase catalytic core